MATKLSDKLINTNKHFWRRYQGLESTLFLVATLRNVNIRHVLTLAISTPSVFSKSCSKDSKTCLSEISALENRSANHAQGIRWVAHGTQMYTGSGTWHPASSGE